MSGKRIKHSGGWTLVELMVATAIFAMAAAATGSLFLFSNRSLVALGNYAILDKKNREALDLLTREVRQAKQVIGFTQTPPTLSFVDGDGKTVVYSFNTAGKQMVRDASDGSHQVLLENCDLLEFKLFKRNPLKASYELLPIATSQFKYTAKVLVLTWKTSIMLPGTHRVSSEHVQTARIVIRKARTSD